MNIDGKQFALAQEVHALAIAAYQQTGIPAAYSDHYTQIEDHPIGIHASVLIMPENEETISFKGSSSPYPGEELNLQELRDSMVNWIAQNRKNKATESVA